MGIGQANVKCEPVHQTQTTGRYLAPNKISCLELVFFCMPLSDIFYFGWGVYMLFGALKMMKSGYQH